MKQYRLSCDIPGKGKKFTSWSSDKKDVERQIEYANKMRKDIHHYMEERELENDTTKTK